MDSSALTTAAPADSTEPELAFIRGKISRLLRSLDRSFIERDSQIRLALLAFLCGHHVLLLGPPGTAKSLLARALCASLHDATFFEYLLSKFTHPDELFGPVSIPGLKEEDYRRLTEGYLPCAHIAFLDEIFKANSALWFAVADAELRLLEVACAGEPLRAAACAVAWIAHVLRAHGALDAEAEESSAEAEISEEEGAALREQLAHLMRRRVPEDFPMPVPSAFPQERGPLGLGAALREQLGMEGATAIAAAAACECDEALLALGSLAPGLGWDFSTGTLHQTLLSRIQGLSALLGKLPVLRRIAEELGRIEALERQKRRAERGGRETVVGVRVGGELSDALACELALLADPETEDLFFQRFVEHRLVCLELFGTTMETTPADEQRGPAIACVDTSGSMQGAPAAVAKALILAVVRQLVPQGRAVELLLFGGPGEATPLRIQRGRQGLAHLLDFLSMGFHAGTDYDTPLLRALELLKTDTYAKADILVVTDGLCRASARVAEQVAEVKEHAEARVLSVVVGGDPNGVDAFSDQVWLIDPSAPIAGGLDLRRWRRGQ